MVIFSLPVWLFLSLFRPLSSHSKVLVDLLDRLSGRQNLMARQRNLVLVSSLFLLLFSFPSYASVASASNAERYEEEKEVDIGDANLPVPGSISDEEWEEFQERMTEINGSSDETGLSAFVLDDTFLDYMYYHFRDLLVADVASASEAKKETLDKVSDGDGVLESLIPYAGTSDIAPLSSNVQNDYVNCVRYDCVVDGKACTLLFPTNNRGSLFIDSDGLLWNMSTSNVQGRVIYDDFTPTATSGTLVYLTPCLGNNFNSVYNNGSPNYIRRYYWSSGRLTYDETYVTIKVESAPFSFFTEDTVQYVLILIGGAMLLCLLKKSLR